jgi:PAS domain S-box-containing protein
MEDVRKTKKELVEELNKLRIQLEEFHSCQEEKRQMQGRLQKALHELHIDNSERFPHEHITHTLKLILEEFTRVIQSSQEQFRTIIEKSADGVIIIDKDGIVRFFNPAAETIFDRNAKDMMGNFFGFPLVSSGTTEIEIITERRGIRFAEMRVVTILWEGERAYLASIRDITRRKHAQEALKRARDELEIRVKERTKELTEAISQLEQEIIERKRSQEEMKQIKEKYENLIKNIPDAIYSILPDKKNTTIFMSERWKDWTGFMPEDFYAAPEKWFDSIHCDDRDNFIDLHQKILENPHEYLFEYRVVHKDTGKQYYLRDHGVPIRDRDNRVIRFDGIVTNVTERKKLQEKLIKAEKLATVGQLASCVSHELRNPLNVIATSLYYLKSKMMNLDEKVIKHLKILQREVNRSYRIISNILDFSKNQQPLLMKCDLNSIVFDSLASLDIPHNITVKKELTTSMSYIVIDPDHIRLVFDNLILNAFQSISNGGIVVIRTREKTDCIEVEFEDTGKGISQENIEQIFDPLFTTRPKGIGLGLAIVKEIIERYEGHIEVKSKVNEGSTFTIRFPLEREKTISS